MAKAERIPYYLYKISVAAEIKETSDVEKEMHNATEQHKVPKVEITEEE